MKGTDIECTTIECILPWVMRNWAGCKIFGVVGYTSSDIDLVCTTTGYARPISLLAFTTVGYASSEIDLTYTTIGYARLRLISLLAYRTVGNASSVIHLAYPTIGYTSSETDLVYTAIGNVGFSALGAG